MVRCAGRLQQWLRKRFGWLDTQFLQHFRLPDHIAFVDAQLGKRLVIGFFGLPEPITNFFQVGNEGDE